MNVWFLLGLCLGLAICGGYWFSLNAKLRRLVQKLNPDVLAVPFSSTSRLTRAIAVHQQAYQSLQQELQSLKFLFQVAPIGFLQVDEDNQLLACNPKACDLLGIQQPHLEMPRLLMELARSYELDALIEETRHSQKNCHREWILHRADSDYTRLSQEQPRPLRGHGFPMATGCVGVFLESREETALLAQQRDRWISDVAHELKTPLTSIRLVAETLQTRLEPPMRDWIDRLLIETIRLSILVQDLLDLNQLQVHPSARLTFKSVDLPRLIESAWLSLELLAQEKQIQLDYIGPERLLIRADEARLHRVLLNLFDNSIKYSPVQQRIRVQLHVSQDQANPSQAIHLEVIDAGTGFPETALPLVFERFYRADPSRARHVSGTMTGISDSTPQFDLQHFRKAEHRRVERRGRQLPQLSSSSGLGLAIVRQIVEAHQGSVKASNHPETGGAWLEIFLPQQMLEPEGPDRNHP